MKLNKSKIKTATQKEQLRALFPDIFSSAKKKESDAGRSELFDSPAFLYNEKTKS